MIQNPIGVFQKHTGRLGDTFVFHFGGIKRAIVTSNPEVMQHVLKTNCDNYHKSEIQMKRMGHFLGKGLLTSHGEVWRAQRRLIQRGFDRNELAALAGIMQESLEESMAAFQSRVFHAPVDIYNELMRIAFRMVARSLFRARMRDEDVEFISGTISTIQKFMVRQIVQPYLERWFAITGELRRHEEMRTRGDQIVLDCIRSRRQETTRYHDLLQILLDARYSDGEGMSDEAVLSESMQLLLAGHETSSNALAWTLFLLSRHPEHIQLIREEFKRVVGRTPIQYSDVPKLEYTAQVIEESLRLYPPFWMLDRVALDDDHVAGIEIPRGSIVIVFVYGAHHSKKLWHNPEAFNPARFGRESKKAQAGFTHLPFGGGPRGCIGRNYAMLQMLMILQAVLTGYDMELAPNQAVVAQPMIILKPRNGIYMTFTPAKKLQFAD